MIAAIDWQLMAVGVCLAWSLWIVARRARSLFGSRRASGCGSGCSTCATTASDSSRRDSTAEPSPGFVPLESLHSGR